MYVKVYTQDKPFWEQTDPFVVDIDLDIKSQLESKGIETYNIIFSYQKERGIAFIFHGLCSNPQEFRVHEFIPNT